MTPKLDKQGLIAALCTTATWGTVGVFVRWLPGWSPFAVLAGRFIFATAVMIPIVFLASSVRYELTRTLRTPIIWWLSLPAIGGYVLGTTAFQMAPIGEVTLLITTSPLFVIAYKYFRRLRIKQSESIGMLVATAGVCVILLPQLSTGKVISSQTIIGYLLALVAAAMLALYALWFNTLNKQGIAPKAFNVVFVTCLLGGFLSLLYTIFFPTPSVEIRIDRQVILVLVGLGILATALPSLCYTVAAQRLPVVVTTAILLLEPVFAVLFASVALQEFPSLWFGIGSLLVFWGLLSIAKGAN